MKLAFRSVVATAAIVAPLHASDRHGSASVGSEGTRLLWRVATGLSIAVAALAFSVRSEAAPAATAGFTESLAGDPPLSVDQALLDKSLICTAFTHPDKPAVLLVHGTFTNGYEQFEATYKPLLTNLGHDVCYVTYPDRGFGDQQISAEYVVNAIRQTYLRSGRPIAMIGHSQGVSVSRWALRWFPATRAAVDDFISLAGPNNGIYAGLPFELVASLGLVGVPEAFLQFKPDSNFIRAKNSGGQTPGAVSYTALYTQMDELIQPVYPVPAGALDFGLGNPRVANVLLQDVCPTRIADHLSIAFTDALAYKLVIDALTHVGPANVARTVAEAGGPTRICGLLPLAPTLVYAPLPQVILGLLTAVSRESGQKALHLSNQEPPLKPYAR